MPKNDFGASHWSSDKVWRRRAKALQSETPTGDHPELEPSIEKVIQLLKNERLTLGQMHFVLVKVTNRLIYKGIGLE
jgi:hypothetical protein